MAGTLFIVATPIGNLADFSERGITTLRNVAVVYAEDTRHSRVLLDHFGIATPLRSLHEHNEAARSAEVQAALERGDDVALLTDAGTPAVSDPGAEVVRRLAASAAQVTPIPGASALTAALSVAGFPVGEAGVWFIEFLPSKGSERAATVAAVVAHPGVVVFFEAPHRLAAALRALATLQPTREACACRELTKMHEEVRRGTLAQLAEWAEAIEPRGELTLVLGPFALPHVPPEEAAIDAALGRCLDAGLSARDAATAVAAMLELPRRLVYGRCQKLRHES